MFTSYFSDLSSKCCFEPPWKSETSIHRGKLCHPAAKMGNYKAYWKLISFFLSIQSAVVLSQPTSIKCSRFQYEDPPSSPLTINDGICDIGNLRPECQYDCQDCCYDIDNNLPTFEACFKATECARFADNKTITLSRQPRNARNRTFKLRRQPRMGNDCKFYIDKIQLYCASNMSIITNWWECSPDGRWAPNNCPG